MDGKEKAIQDSVESSGDLGDTNNSDDMGSKPMTIEEFKKDGSVLYVMRTTGKPIHEQYEDYLTLLKFSNMQPF